MSNRYDAIVVGARCAGAATAMLLARAGHRVLLLDRARFPSDIPHGHYIHMDGPRRLASWGLLDEVLDTGCPPITSILRDDGDFPLVGHGLGRDGIPIGLGPRRSRLDEVLVSAAVRAGVELREGFAVDELVSDGGRVAGVRGRDLRTRSRVVERAAVVIGADGRNSMVARAVGAPTRESSGTMTCWYWSYWSGVPVERLELYVRDRRAIFLFPTNDRLASLAVGWPVAELPRVRADIDGQLMAVVDNAPGLGERMRAGTRVERFYGAAQLPNFVRGVHGPGWALVGDAGCHKDPMLGLGICDALRDAELLADALHDGLAGNGPMEDVLAAYERRRNEATLPGYRENLMAARMDPLPSEVYALRAALRDDPEETRRFFHARQGLIPRDEFFAEDNIRRIVGRASAGALEATAA